MDAEGLQNATDFVLAFYVELSYGLLYIPVAASAGAPVGGPLLSLGAFRADVMGLRRCLLLLAWAWAFPGVLKDADAGSFRGAIALCVVIVPIGVQVLRNRVTALNISTAPTPPHTARTRRLW